MAGGPSTSDFNKPALGLKVCVPKVLDRQETAGV